MRPDGRYRGVATLADNRDGGTTADAGDVRGAPGGEEACGPAGTAAAAGAAAGERGGAAGWAAREEAIVLSIAASAVACKVRKRERPSHDDNKPWDERPAALATAD